VPKALQPLLFLALPAIAWGGMFHVAQRVLPQVDAFWLSLLRIAPTALLMIAFLAWREPLVTPSAPPEANSPKLGWKIAISGLLGFGVFNFALYSGISLTTPEHGAIIMAMTPLLGAALAWLSNGRPPPRLTLICIAIALVGAIMVVTGHAASNSAAPQALLGDALALLGALAWAFYLRSSGWFPCWSSLRFSAFSTAVGTLWIVLGLLAFSLMGWTQPPHWQVLPALASELIYMTFLGTLASLLLWNRGIALIGPVNGALFMNLVPVSAFVIGIALGHRPSLMELAGAMLVLSALLTNNLLLRRPLPASA